MALPTVTVLNAAIDTIYSVFSNRKTRPGNRYAVGLLQKMRRVLLNAYRGDIDFVVTDITDSSIESFMSPGIAADGEDYDFALASGQDENLFVLMNLSESFAIDDDLTVTNALESNLKAFFAGELATGLGQAPVVGDIFKVAGIGDTIDDDLETANRSAVADEDWFIV